jgi:hypothetical protein
MGLTGVCLSERGYGRFVERWETVLLEGYTALILWVSSLQIVEHIVTDVALFVIIISLLCCFSCLRLVYGDWLTGVCSKQMKGKWGEPVVPDWNYLVFPAVPDAGGSGKAAETGQTDG